jgi:hypothetical protein
MLAEIFMLSVEADVRTLIALTPTGSDARFVPIELPVSSAANDLPQQPWITLAHRGPRSESPRAPAGS